MQNLPRYPDADPEPEPTLADLDGPSMRQLTRIALAHQGEWSNGWEYKVTCGVGNEPFDPAKPPPGDGWILNEFAGDHGHTRTLTSYNAPMHKVHWRRRKGTEA